MRLAAGLNARLASDAAPSLAAEVWRGHIAHSLLFYRQNALSHPDELLALGRGFSIGRTGDLPRPRAKALSPGWRAADAALASGRIDDALRGLTRAIRREPAEGAFLVLRGMLQLERYWGSYRLSDRALADFEKARELSRDRVWAALGAGMAHEAHRRYTKAIERFDEACELAPAWMWPWVFRGVCRWYQADFAGSVHDFQRAARLEPGSELPLLFSARAKADIRDRSLVRDLDRALTLAPSSGFVRSWRGRALFVLDRRSEAVDDLQESIRLLPDYDRGWSWLGVSKVESGEFAPALRLLRRARRLNPHYPTTLYPMARASLLLGRPDEAGRALRAAAMIDRQGVWVEQRISMSHPNPACLRSLDDLDAYIKERPGEAWAWAWRGQTRLLLKRYWDALSDLERAAGLGARGPWPLVWRAEALRRLGYPALALRHFERALSRDGSIHWGHAGRGWCLLASGRFEEADSALTRALALQPACAEAWAWRGQARLKRRRPEAAASDLAKAVELRPNLGWPARSLWESWARLGRWSEAAAAADRLSRAGGGRSDRAWAVLGWTLREAGRMSAARKAAAQALELNPSQPLARSMKSGSPPATLEEALALCRVEPAAAFSAERLAAHCRERETPACWNAFRRGRWTRAVAEAEAGRPLNDAERLLFLGWLKLRAGDLRGAVESASRALDESLDPGFEPALLLRAEAQRLLEAGA
jgi:tetratricopeptide (TPR) repeat protein